MAYRVNARRICLNAMLLAVSLVLSYLEAILPLTAWIPLPGFKLGLANIIVTMIFAAVSPYDAAVVSFCRIAIMGLLFGNASSFFFSLCGGILSYIGLWVLFRCKRQIFSMIGVSVGCAVLHNIGQIIAASALFGTEIILNYMPVLLIAALIFGSLTGILLQLILPRFKEIKSKIY